MVCDIPLWNLRYLKRMALPDGLETVGTRWFAGSFVEEVSVPASVLEI